MAKRERVEARNSLFTALGLEDLNGRVVYLPAAGIPAYARRRYSCVDALAGCLLTRLGRFWYRALSIQSACTFV